MSLIREHTVINFLFWSFPALSAILATTHVAENLILHSEEPLLFLFRVVQQDFTLEIEPSWMMFLISLSVSLGQLSNTIQNTGWGWWSVTWVGLPMI